MRTAAYLAALLAGVLQGQAGAIVIQFDYSYDSNNFFGDHPEGVDALAAAAEAFSGFADDLAAIEPAGDNEWTAEFGNPGTGQMESVPNLVIPADTVIIYVGGRMLSGSTLAYAGPGGYTADGSPEWVETVRYRGQTAEPVPVDFGPWGGTICFDADRDWHFGVENPPGVWQVDFLSVATHEIAHILGLGACSAWSVQVVDGRFTGAASSLAYGASVPVSGDGGHWGYGTMSTVSGLPQETLMDPNIDLGARKWMTLLDYAGMADIGWEYPPPGDVNADGVADGADYTVWADHYLSTGLPPGDQGGWLFGNFNGDDVVDGADYTLWADHYVVAGSPVPEPIALLILASGAAIISGRRSKGTGNR